MRARAAGWLTVACVIAGGSAARADDDFAGGVVIFARGAALYQVDARGRNETELAALPAKVTVRALRSDADGSVLLADLAGRWAWLPLDGASKSLLDLPCADGPAQLAIDGTAVLCRSPRAASQSILVELVHAPGAPARTGKVTPIDVPPATARLAGEGAERRLVWADAAGVWSAPPGDPRRKVRAAADAPLRGFLASPDGTRAIATYPDQIYTDAHHSQPAEVLMTLQLDGKGARRKAIRDGVAVEWSQDSQWILVQDGASACIMRVSGGQYKCWKGYTAASLASDGRWALALGNRDSGKPSKPSKGGKPSKPSKRAPPPPPPPPSPSDEPSDEPEAATDAPSANDDVSVAPPTGPRSLYRLRLEGAFTDRPTLLVKVVDGAAVWVSKGS
ncbi:MAG TPA: hypothetical protein VFP84_00905 [Kofleriaceae bacterium]|nr:hypothetical protein [Kofleriaceae bacterium]